VRSLVRSVFALPLLGLTGCSSPDAPGLLGAFAQQDDKPLVLIYRGPGGCTHCSEGMAALYLNHPRIQFAVDFIGPDEKRKLGAQGALNGAAVFVQPGGDGDETDAWKALEQQVGDPRALLQGFVRAGGRYQGACMGAYLAGNWLPDWPGYGVLGAQVDQWITTPGATATREDEYTLVEVTWRDQPKTRWSYFQDGSYVDSAPPGATVLSKYKANDKINALVAPFGRGRVAVSGTHFEATQSWYDEHELKDPDGRLDADLGYELIDELMK
jgi:glutamine amidotransferase-like uncharacterized protein